MKYAWAFLLAAAPLLAQGTAVGADSIRGAALFTSLACVQCHGMNGAGGSMAPDLGLMADRNFTPASLAATMWNHAPAMWSAMQAANVARPDVDEQAAADLFAFFYSTRFFEKPGDAARGKRIFTDRGCAGCHGLDTQLQPGVPSVSEWGELNRPFALGEAMWNHMPHMIAAMQAKRIAWPMLSGQDLDDLLVYLRNLPATRQLTHEFIVTSGTKGKQLFQEKGCRRCHDSDNSFAGRIRGRTLTDIAAEMWNHGPRMAATNVPPAAFQSGEMRELLSYIWARQFFEDSRDPQRGRHVFVAKHCAGCHETGAAPPLPVAGHIYSAASMIAALWRHGPAMLERMKSRGVAWPRLDAADMSGLIAYLNRSQKRN
jgi:mono/diheme cytochrome c family protein